MPVMLTHDTIKLFKKVAQDLSEGVGSSHLSEAIAAGLGYRTNASLRTALDQGPTLGEVSDRAFKERLTALGNYQHPDDLLSSAIHEATMRRIREIADQHPRMTIHDLNPSIGRHGPHKTEEQWVEMRDRLLSGEAVEMFQNAELWLAVCKKGDTIYRKQASYGLKHDAERWIKKNHPERHYYIATGAFIAAAIANGFSIEPSGGDAESRDCYLNIASKPSKRQGITTLCDRKETYEVVAPSMLTLLSDIIRGWVTNRTAKRQPETSFFLVKHGLKRIQRDAENQVRVSGRGWSVLLTIEGGINNLTPKHIRVAVLRGELDTYLSWLDGTFPYEHMPWAPPRNDREFQELMSE